MVSSPLFPPRFSPLPYPSNSKPSLSFCSENKQAIKKERKN